VEKNKVKLFRYSGYFSAKARETYPPIECPSK
jgi:hypothetical protein